MSAFKSTLGARQFPLAILSNCMSSMLPADHDQLLTECSVHTLPMGLLLLPHGENLNPVTVEYTGQDRVGDNGGTWVHHTPVHNVLLTQARRD